MFVKKLTSVLPVLLWLALAIFPATNAFADFIIHGVERNVYRIDSAGNLKKRYSVPDLYPWVESWGQDHVVTPDLKTVYNFSNSVGASAGFAVDVSSGVYQPQLDLPFSMFLSRLSFIRPQDPFGRGDFFSIVREPSDMAHDILRRFNRSTGAIAEDIVGGGFEPAKIRDFTFDSAHALYVSTDSNILAFSDNNPNPLFKGFFEGNGGVLIPAISGTLAAGNDGFLYVRNHLTGNVDRYKSDGSFVSTLIPSAKIQESTPSGSRSRGSIQFGPDGDLYLFQYTTSESAPSDNHIGRYDGETGELITLTPVSEYAPFTSGRITILPVPEPSFSASISVILAIAVWRGRRI